MKKNTINKVASHYELIVAAKMAVDGSLSDLIEEKGVHSPDNLATVIELIPEWVAREIYGRPATRKEQIALRVVIETGHWHEEIWGWHFYMPSTKDCLNNWKAINRAIRNKRPVKLYGSFWSYDEEWYSPLERVDLSRPVLTPFHAKDNRQFLSAHSGQIAVPTLADKRGKYRKVDNHGHIRVVRGSGYFK